MSVVATGIDSANGGIERPGVRDQRLAEAAHKARVETAPRLNDRIERERTVAAARPLTMQPAPAPVMQPALQPAPQPALQPMAQPAAHDAGMAAHAAVAAALLADRCRRCLDPSDPAEAVAV